jgi:hypothetical protein
MEGWAICSGCGHERRFLAGELVEHRRWHSWYQIMLRCDGSGQVPLKVTT